MSSAHADPAPRPQVETTVFPVILAVSACHLLNDMMQSLLPAIYPNLKASLGLSFSQIGVLGMVYQLTASILQPLALPGGTLFSLGGLVALSAAHSFPHLLAGAALLGMGSSVFHPEASRVARMAAGERAGLAQSLFQVGGNAGSALGPLAAAVVVVRWGQSSLAFFALLALLSLAILWQVATWYRDHGLARLHEGRRRLQAIGLPKAQARRGLIILLALIFSKYVYLTSITSYLTFYLIERFELPVHAAQLYLFAFLGAVAAGTILGGPIGDRVGRKSVIWVSILGTLPFTLALPHVGLFWSGPLLVVIGLLLASAFPAIVVFAQELAPDKPGAISGLFFGFSFGMAGLGAGVLGKAADLWSVEAVYEICAVLPVLGLLAALLPDLRRAPKPTPAVDASSPAP